MKKQKLILLTTDAVALTIAFLLAILFRQLPPISNHFGYLNFNIASYFFSFIVASLLLLTVFGGFKLYQVRQIELSARIFTVLKALAIWVFVCAAVTYLIKFDFSRGVFFTTVALTTILICLGRYFYYRHRQDKSNGQGPSIEAIIIGTGNRAHDIEKQIKNTLPHASCRKLDYANPSTHSYLISRESTDIFLADETLSRDQVLSIVVDDKLGHHSFRVILDVFRLATGEVQLNNIDEIPSISPRNEPQTAYKLIKRLMDLFIGTVGLIIISPLWLLIVVLIRLDSKGPALIYQTRIGWNGQPFIIIKFRTMQDNVHIYEFAPRNESDNRITRVGRFLRRLSLDELPQLWNIWRGDMSLVGPRPEMEFLVNKYEPWQRFRLRAKPGLTGLWQILGRKDIPLHENLEYDFYYVTNRSLLLDSTIILKTIPAVLFGRGAY